MSKKEQLNVVVVGHVDHGKSTLIGRLLFDTNSLPEAEIERVKKISKEKGKKFEYAYLLDAFEEEQNQGITIDITKLQFATEERDYVIIDAPGHKEFLKNMISGASQGDVALLLIDCEEGIKEQSRRHGFILSLLGIKNVFVIVNKMDLVNYDENKFKAIKNEFNEFLTELDINPIEYIPISALKGENLTKKSENLKWYRGNTVIEALNGLDVSKAIKDKALRFPIQDVYKFDHRRIIAGRIESGFLEVGDKIVIYPSLKESKIISIESWGNGGNKLRAEEGESIGITIADEFFNKRGEVIVKKDYGKGPIKSKSFVASVFWMGNRALEKGKEYKLKLSTNEVIVKVKEINKSFDTATLENKLNAEKIKKNDVGEVILESKDILSYDEFSQISNTGRFVLVEDYDVCGGGIILSNDSSNESKNINKKLLVSSEEKKAAFGKSKVIWLRGLPGSGKNEIAINLEKELFDLGKKVAYINEALVDGYYDKEFNIVENDDKEKNNTIAYIAKVLLENGITPIITEVNLKEEEREEIRNIIGKANLIEIFIDTAKEICVERSKGNKLAKEYIYDKEGECNYHVTIEEKKVSLVNKSQELLKVLGNVI